MVTLVRIASAVLVALFVLTACGSAPTSATLSVFAPAQLGCSISRIVQPAVAAARRAAMNGRQADGTLRLSFPSLPPLDVRTSIERLTAEVNDSANNMIRRHVDDLPCDQAVRVVKGACLVKFANDFYGEEDATEQFNMIISEFGGNRMLTQRLIALFEEMGEASNSGDMMQIAATGAVCEAVGFVRR